MNIRARNGFLLGVVIFLLAALALLAFFYNNVTAKVQAEHQDHIAPLIIPGDFRDISWGVSGDYHIQAVFISRQTDSAEIFRGKIIRYIKDHKLIPIGFSENTEVWVPEEIKGRNYTVPSVFRYRACVVTFATSVIKKPQPEPPKSFDIPIPLPVPEGGANNSDRTQI